MKLALVLLSAAASALADGAHSPVKRVHHAHVAQNMARRNETQDLSKRESFTGTATWYDVTVAAGACGDWMGSYDNVVALNSPQLQAYGGYQNGKPTSCYRSITIQANGATSQAVIMDECPPCAWGSFDLSMGLFQKFAGLDAGVFQLTWWFNDGSGGGTGTGGTGGNTDNGNNNNNNNQQPTTTEQPPPPSSTPEPTPSSTPPTSSDPPPTSSSSSSEESVNAQSAPTPSQYQDNLVAAPQAVIQIAALLHAAAGH